MVVVRNFFINLTIVTCTIILVLYLLVLSLNTGYLDKPIKHVIKFYLGQKNAPIKIGNLQIRKNILIIDKIFMDLANNTKGEISDFKINFTVNNILTNPVITNIFTINNLVIISSDNQPIISTKVSVTQTIELYKKQIATSISLTPIKTIILRDSYGKSLTEGQGVCIYKNGFTQASEKTIDCELTFGKQANLLFNTTLNEDLTEARVKVNNIPIMIYKIAEKFLAQNDIILFLQQYIKDGYIIKGEVNLKLDKSSLATYMPEASLKGNLHIIDLEYKYDEAFPSLKKMDTFITIAGSKANMVLNQAYSSNSLLTGLITFEWKGRENSLITVRGEAKGEVVDLIDFISEENYQKTKDQGVDLKKITGQANTKIEILIPISSNIKNSYNISTLITNANLTAFNNNIALKNAKITGLFDGGQIILTGVGKINDNASNFVYQHNIIANKEDDYENILNIKTTIIAKSQQLGVLKLITGSNILELEYKKYIDGKTLISASSNLKNLEFYIDKISIHKKLGDEAKLIMTGNLIDSLNGIMNFKIVGDNKLEIVGKVSVQNDKYYINLPTILYKDTNLIGKLLIDDNNLNADIQGQQLDLSLSDMMQFLEKTGDTKNSHLNVNIKRVILKNNISLEDFNLQINCNKIKCFSGSLLSTIDNKPFKMLLTDKQDREQWVITCNNAGALLKGIGMYNNMKSGIINLILETKRQEIKKGEIIPILDGTFDIKHFGVTDIFFLTRIVSFVSFPGFMSFILNNKDIMFTNMHGQFSYIGNTMEIINSSSYGPFFDFTMKGIIDTDKRQIKLKGNVIPSFFFVSSVITKIPIIGKMFSKVAPYSIELEYKE